MTTPKARLSFYFLIRVDIVSHWIQMLPPSHLAITAHCLGQDSPSLLIAGFLVSSLLSSFGPILVPPFPKDVLTSSLLPPLFSFERQMIQIHLLISSTLGFEGTQGSRKVAWGKFSSCHRRRE